VVAGAFASRRLHRAAVYVPAYWALVQIDELTITPRSSEWFVGLGLAAALFAVIVAVRARPADARVGGWLEMGLVTAVGGLVATMFAVGHEPTAALVGVAVVGTTVVLIDQRWTGVYLASAAVVGLVATNAAVGVAGYDADGWLGWAAIGAGLALVWLVHRTPLA